MNQKERQVFCIWSAKLLSLISLFLFLGVLCSGCGRVGPGMSLEMKNYCGRKYVKTRHFPIPIQEISPRLIRQIKEKECSRELNCISQSWRPKLHHYFISPADKLHISVWGHPELNNPSSPEFIEKDFFYTVDEEGAIFFPHLGKIVAGGKTVRELQQDLSQKLATIVKQATVTVELAQYRGQFVNIIGEVFTPRVLPIDDIPMTPLDAINLAGGATEYGDLRYVQFQRGEKIHELNLLPGKASSSLCSTVLMHGDLVYVPNKKNAQVYVIGEVQFPQAIQMDSDEVNLSQAIALSSSVDPFSSNPAQIFVFREDPEGKKCAFHLNGFSPGAFLLANEFPLRKKDIIYVGVYKPAVLNRIMTNYMSTTRVISDISRSTSYLDIVD